MAADFQLPARPVLRGGLDGQLAPLGDFGVGGFEVLALQQQQARAAGDVIVAVLVNDRQVQLGHLDGRHLVGLGGLLQEVRLLVGILGLLRFDPER